MKRIRDGDFGGGDDIVGDDGNDGDVRVRSAEGEVVAWPRSAAARSAALANWVSDTGGAGALAVPAWPSMARPGARARSGDCVCESAFFRVVCKGVGWAFNGHSAPLPAETLRPVHTL